MTTTKPTAQQGANQDQTPKKQNGQQDAALGDASPKQQGGQDDAPRFRDWASI